METTLNTTPFLQLDAPLSPEIIERRLKTLETIVSASPVSIPAKTIEQLATFVKYQRGDYASHGVPKDKLAAVLILLNVLPDGQLGVTLTTRSSKMRTHPGDTAFPGGRYDLKLDSSVQSTALREANEEISLAVNDPSEPTLLELTQLQPFVSATLLVVIPIVYLYIPTSQPFPTLIPNPSEVDHIFNLPLNTLSPAHSEENEVKLEYSYVDIPWLDDQLYRLRSFDHSSLPSKISGLTADILLHLLRITNRPTDPRLERNDHEWDEVAEGQMSWKDLFEKALLMAAQGKRYQRITASGKK